MSSRLLERVDQLASLLAVAGVPTKRANTKTEPFVGGRCDPGQSPDQDTTRAKGPASGSSAPSGRTLRVTDVRGAGGGVTDALSWRNTGCRNRQGTEEP